MADFEVRVALSADYYDDDVKKNSLVTSLKGAAARRFRELLCPSDDPETYKNIVRSHSFDSLTNEVQNILDAKEMGSTTPVDYLNSMLQASPSHDVSATVRYLERKLENIPEKLLRETLLKTALLRTLSRNAQYELMKREVGIPFPEFQRAAHLAAERFPCGPSVGRPNSRRERSPRAHHGRERKDSREGRQVPRNEGHYGDRAETKRSRRERSPSPRREYQRARTNAVRNSGQVNSPLLLQIHKNGYPLTLLIDTGAAISLIAKTTCEKLRLPSYPSTEITLTAFCGTSHPSVVALCTTLTIKAITISAYIVPFSPGGADILVGTDTLAPYNFIINYTNKSVTCSAWQQPLTFEHTPSSTAAALEMRGKAERGTTKPQQLTRGGYF